MTSLEKRDIRAHQRAPVDVSHFDQLPNAALISAAAAAAVIGVGVSTIWRLAKSSPDFPKPVRIGGRCTRWKVGEIRAFIEGRAA